MSCSKSCSSGLLGSRARKKPTGFRVEGYGFMGYIYILYYLILYYTILYYLYVSWDFGLRVESLGGRWGLKGKGCWDFGLRVLGVWL